MGIGGDGLIRAVPSRFLPEGRELLEQDPDAEWFMDYRNGDGSLSEMCGNGVRVFVHFLDCRGIGGAGPGRNSDHRHPWRRQESGPHANGYAVDMGPWEFIFPEEATSKAMDALVSADGLEVPARPLRQHGQPPHGGCPGRTQGAGGNAIVQGAAWSIPSLPTEPTSSSLFPPNRWLQDGVGTITMRVHERGVGETQSCGTGACAAAVAIRHWAGDTAPNDWHVNVPGGVVDVKFFPGAGRPRACGTQRPGRDRGYWDAFLTRMILKDLDVLSRATV